MCARRRRNVAPTIPNERFPIFCNSPISNKILFCFFAAYLTGNVIKLTCLCEPVRTLTCHCEPVGTLAWQSPKQSEFVQSGFSVTGGDCHVASLLAKTPITTSFRAGAHTGVAIPKIGGDCQEVNCPRGKRDHSGVRRLFYCIWAHILIDPPGRGFTFLR